MGWLLSVVTAILNRDGEQFVQRDEVRRFGSEIYVSWARSVDSVAPDGWVSLAENTLYAQFSPEHVFGYATNQTSNEVSYTQQPGVYKYADRFYMGDRSSLIHLVLPRNHLPILNSFRPFPAYALPHGERLAIGWIWQPGIWYRFLFKEAEALDFISQAQIVSQSVTEGQSEAIEKAEELENIETRLRIWNGNRRLLEQQAAIHGTLTPVSIHNQLEDAMQNIKHLEERRAIFLSRW